MNGTVYIHNNIRHQYHEILKHFNININTYLNSNTEQLFQTILKPEYFLLLCKLQHQYQYQHLNLGLCNVNINNDIGKLSFVISIIKGVKLHPIVAQYQHNLQCLYINIKFQFGNGTSAQPCFEYAKSFTTV